MYFGILNMFRIWISSQTHSQVVEHFRAPNVLNSAKEQANKNLLTSQTIS